jgi:F1F0 ATPase subunit 2
MSDLHLMRVWLYAVLGLLLGVGYFSALGWNVRLYVGRRAGWGAVLLHVLRLGAIGGALTLCARQGALPLLTTVVGFQVARMAAVSQKGRALERAS